ncbi:Type I restriction-modification system, DNA-methyltransferase subunit M [hydrothermal vent metagenome]|uniref:site-specific DNA-methyltransferase (adenine-specific) n=1 Tax=hydrothermal vent metagenome TaxID=652676 RepID=A0A3B0V2Q9_9ZZZZ
MSEELLQRDLLNNPEKIGTWDFYNIGATSVKALKEYGIVREVDYGNVEKKKIDALLVKRKNILAVVEYKKPSEFRTKKQREKAVKQEIEVAQKLGAKLFIATDTKTAIWLNAQTGNYILDESGNLLTSKFDPKDERLPALLEKLGFSINKSNDTIKPKELVNPTGLAKQIWQDVWSVSGATPENCLYTFVELFIFKYLSDLNILRGVYSFDTLIQNYEVNNPEEVLQSYANTIRPKIKSLFPENSIDKTTIINGTIFVSKDQQAVEEYSTVFKKVLLKFKDYGKLEYIDRDFKSLLFESFLKESISKKNWGQFFTPIKVVRSIVEMAKDEIREGIKICDPACGVGKFLLEVISSQVEQLYEVKGGELFPKITLHGFDKGFDKDEQKTIILAKANMLIYLSDQIKENPDLTKKFSQLFNTSFILKTNSILGTLSDPVENEYDLILTNPPYVTSGSSNLKEEIKKTGKLVNYFSINAIGVEGLFIEWIIRALKSNGKAFVIVPDGSFNRRNDKNLRQFIIDECFIDGIISLPANTFFTTNKKTYILCITKKLRKDAIQSDPVFTYLVSEIGESRDVNRFDIDQDDLSEGVTLFSFFKGNKSGFRKINRDPRCKVVSSKYFAANVETNWIIDRLWDEDEKVSLGLIEKNNQVSMIEFSSIIEDAMITLRNLQEQLNDISIVNDDTQYGDFKIGEIFDLTQKSNNSKFTKTFVNQHKGDIPVYSASKFPESVDYGYVENNLPNIRYFNDCLTWNIDGSIGKVHFREGRFSLSEKVIPLVVKSKLTDVFDLQFLKYAIEDEFAKHDFGFSNKAGKSKIRNIEISVPIDENNEPDIKKQSKIAERYQKIEEIKNQIAVELNAISSTNVTVL